MRNKNFTCKFPNLLFLSVLLLGCQIMLDPRDSGIFYVHATTDPPGARLTLVNIDSGGASNTMTAYSPNVIYYNPSPRSGAFLTVSHPGYQEQVIRLKPEMKNLHVVLAPETGKKKPNNKSWGFTMGFGSRDVLPDLSHVADESSIAEAINETLESPEKSSSEKDAPIISIVNIEYPEAKKYTGKIHVASKPSGAELLLDGRSMGSTPREITDVQIGVHRIALLKNGYETWMKRITVKEKQEKRIMVRMLSSFTSKPQNNLP